MFYFVALFSIVQLLICIIAEYQRLKQPSLLAACRISTQKLLYFVVFVAATLRGAYFTTPVSVFYGGAANPLDKRESNRFVCDVICVICTGSLAAGMGREFGVRLLSAADDVRLAGRLLVG